MVPSPHQGGSESPQNSSNTSSAGAGAAKTQRVGMGALLKQMQAEFPEISASKVRFLEDQGLLHPARTPSGYRKFSSEDRERLRQVLILQRERYLPLKVIRELSENGQLEALLSQSGASEPGAGDGSAAAGAGLPASGQNNAGVPETSSRRAAKATSAPSATIGGRTSGGSGSSHQSETTSASQAAAVPGESDVPSQEPLTMRELCRQSGAGIPLVRELISFGLIHERPGGFDRHDLVIAGAARALRDHGVEPRHLRTLRQAADREIGLVQQAIAPEVAKRSPAASRRASERAGEITQLCLSIHASLVVGQLESVQQKLGAHTPED